jgi:peroxiredoxin
MICSTKTSLAADLRHPIVQGRKHNEKGMTMTICVGDKLPEGVLLRMGDNGPEPVQVSDLTAKRRVVMFAVPGAFTPTCHSAHVPSFIRTKAGFADKGVAEVICVAVNDPFVMGAWAQATGAAEAGLLMLADGTGAFTSALGMDFTAEAVGLMGRSKRYAMVVEDGTVTHLNVETSPGECEISAGEALLAAL